MSTETPAVPLVLAAALLLRLGLSDDHLLYVQPAMRPGLVIGGVVLVAITAGSLLARRTRRTCHARRAAGAPDHHPGAIGWLLALPIAAILVVPMAPLGSYAASRRQAPPPPAPTSSDDVYPPLPPPVDGAAEISLGQFVTLALLDTDRRLEGRVVRLTGFVTSPGGPDGGVHLTRFALACCAADAWATSVALRGLTGAPPPDDTWVTVEGIWQPDPSASIRGQEPEVPALVVTALRRIPTPTDPYEG